MTLRREEDAAGRSAGLAVLALALPVSNLLVGTPAGTPLTAVAARRTPQTAKVAHVLERSCASCHVPGVKTPFYASLPVASTDRERDVDARPARLRPRPRASRPPPPARCPSPCSR